MSHPFAYKAWMETYLPTQENIVQKNSTATCNEWVKLCIDDGSGAACSGPRGNTQLHSVGAYERYSGAKTLETMEGEFTSAMGGMKQYDPFMELHAMFMTKDLDSYGESGLGCWLLAVGSWLLATSCWLFTSLLTAYPPTRPTSPRLRSLLLTPPRFALFPYTPRPRSHSPPPSLFVQGRRRPHLRLVLHAAGQDVLLHPRPGRRQPQSRRRQHAPPRDRRHLLRPSQVRLALQYTSYYSVWRLTCTLRNELLKHTDTLTH